MALSTGIRMPRLRVRAAAAVMDCCRGGDNGHICQMKKKSGETGCRLRSGCDSDPEGLFAAAAWIGNVPNRVQFAVVLTTSAAPVFVPDAVPHLVSASPDAPSAGMTTFRRLA